jgi:serine/threonine-protein kinase HipA
MPRVLEVLIGDRLVGTLTNLPNDNNLFVFDDSYLNEKSPLVLSQGFYGVDRSLIPESKARRKAPAFFANLLPEGHLREYLAARARVNVTRDFPLLWALGADLPGAVVIRDAEGEAFPPEDAAVGKTSDPRKKLRFSLAGVQLKFSAIREAGGVLTIPASGLGGHWVVKLPSLTYKGVPENEWSMMTFANRVGIEVPRISLDPSETIEGLPRDLPAGFGNALSIERFDRTEMGRVHTEDFAQVFRIFGDDRAKYHGASYGSIASALWLISTPEVVAEFTQRLVFSVGIGNADMHLKNWSLIYRDGRTPLLAPAYDYVSTIQYIEDDRLALSLAGSKEWVDVSQESLTSFARRAGIPTGLVLSAAQEMVERMKTVWPEIKGELQITRPAIERIEAHQKEIPLFSHRGHPIAVGQGATEKTQDAPKEIE